MDQGRVRRRRLRVDGLPRTRQLVVRFSEVELADVCRRAQAEGLAAGAWIGDLAVRVARGGEVPGVADRRLLLQELLAFRPGLGGDFARVVDELIDVLVERLS